MEEKQELQELLKNLGVQNLLVNTAIDTVPYQGRQMVVGKDNSYQHIEIKSKTLNGFIDIAERFYKAMHY